jgi:hypothetical protein
MLDMQAGDVNFVTATNAQANLTFAAPAGQRWSIGGVAWSYEGGTLSTDAELNIWAISTTGATNIIFSVDINDDGAGFIIPSEPIKFPHNTAIIFELVAGGTGVVGKLNILGAKRV